MSYTALKEDLIGMNKIIVQNESKKIDEYIRSRNLTMNTSPTGLRYVIDKSSNAQPNRKIGDRVRVAYSLSTLEGKECYTFPIDSPAVFEVNRNEIIKGIEEAVMMMNDGEKAMLIIPSYLGYGKTGDDQKIGRDVILICNINSVNP